MGNVLQFHAALQGLEPVVWRRLQLRSSESFWGLHCALQDVFGWDSYHLHVFRLGEGGDTALEIGIPWGEELDVATLRGWEQPLLELCTDVGKEMTYLYDFGDCWYHQVRFEGSFPAERGRRYPRCLGGANACPPEDVGGPAGYARFLEILSDRSHPEHEEVRAWIGRDFQPEAFDPTAVRFARPLTRLRQAELG